MSVRIQCNECDERIGDSDYLCCHLCYSKYQGKITHLEKRIQALEDENKSLCSQLLCYVAGLVT